VLLWSTVASAFKISLKYLDHLQLLFYAGIFSIIILTLILIVQGRWNILFSYSKHQYCRSVLFGFLNPFLYYMILFKAYDLLPAQEAQPLNYTWAITLAVLSIPLLKQKIGRYDLLGALVSYGGVVVISTQGRIAELQFTNAWGVALALGSTVIWALYWIYNTKDDRDPIAGLLLNFVFGFPFVLIVTLVFSDVRINHLYGLAGAAYVGFFEMGITFVFWLQALKYSVNTAKVGNLIFISPFISLIFIHYFVGEHIRPSTFIGLALIISGLFVQRLKVRAPSS
jgi:drug/metabolite transporter (DMT)-like permease